jgi:flavin reductase (DIM6/NTAB) family NADH-FMN oxidoreductase RutF
MRPDIGTFKHAMARFATGVTVVTTHNNGENFGITVNAFCSVSLEPMLVLISIGKPLYAHDQIEQSGVFAVNVLSLEQKKWADRFAGRHPTVTDRWEGITFSTASTGSPILPDSLSWLDCQVEHIYDGGDHTLFVGRVVESFAGGQGEPLLYYKSKWSRLDRGPVP